MSITGSTLSGNKALASSTGAAVGGALATKYLSGNYSTDVTLTNSTVSGNSATSIGTPTYSFGGGIYSNPAKYTPATITLNNSTIAFNTTGAYGGGVAFAYGGPGVFNSTIVAQNVAGDAASADLASPGMTTIDGDYNLIQSDPTVGGAITFTGTHNIFGQDPLLLALAYNGGTTPTHALDPSSPAIDTGSNPLNLTTDQRGVPYARVVGAAADIGAFELDSDRIFANGFE